MCSRAQSPARSAWWYCSTLGRLKSQHFDIYGDFFFFQAEDGIRDDLVTGVQTCALPIFRDPGLRASIHALVEEERIKTAQALAEREDEFMRLKVEGILDCGELLVAALADGREGHVFGRRTMPEMDLASVACAIQNLWLAARAENVGMGWVSLFDPETLRRLIRMPEGSRPVAILCLGYVPAFYPRPMLEDVDWAHRFGLTTMVHTDYWGTR